MTNEELVLMIRAGRDELIPQLWDQVAKFINYRADKYLLNFPDHYSFYKDDMINESYEWFLKAIKNYKMGDRTFISYLTYYLQKAFAMAVFGTQSDRAQHKPLNTAVSIDKPIDDDEEITISDTLPDEAAEEAFIDIEHKGYWEDVRSFLRDGINHISDQSTRELLMCMLNHNCSRVRALEFMGEDAAAYDKYSNKYNNGIAYLRKYMKKTAARKRAALIGLDCAIYGGGIRRWKNNLFTSEVEKVAIKRADQAMKYDYIEHLTII